MSTLVIQQGHVARTTGATGTTGEQDYARRAADAIQAEFGRRRGHDWQVRVIRADEDDARYAGSAFVAIHCDGSLSATARGASVGYQTAEGQALGQRILAAYEDHGWTGGFRPPNYTSALASYYGVRKAYNRGNRAAVIVEAGFLTNRAGVAPTDRDLLTGPDGATRLARAVADAVIGTKPTPEDPPMLDSDRKTRDAQHAQLLAALESVPNRVWLRKTNDGRWAIQHLVKASTGAHEPVDEAEIVAGVLAGLDPQAIAAAIPTDLASRVVDELGKRVSS